MEYILTRDELNNLVSKDSVKSRDIALFAVREQLLILAGFKCIHALDGGNEYCDDCPCSPIGENHDYDTWKLVCGLSKEYSQ